MIARIFPKLQFFDSNRCLIATIGRVSRGGKTDEELVVLQEENDALECRIYKQELPGHFTFLK